MWETPISFTFLLHHPLGPRCWSYPCDWSCIMPMSILKPAWKEKEQKWRASYFLLSKFHLQSHSIAEELVSWQHVLQGSLGSLISTWLAHTLLKLHYQGKWEKWSWAQLATCQRWKREFVGSCNQKNSGLQVQFDPGFQTVSPNLSLSLSLQFSNLVPLYWLSVQFNSVQSLSHVQLFATPWTAARQASMSTTNSQRLLKWLTLCSNISGLGTAEVASSQARIQWEISFPLSSNPQITRFLPLGVAHLDSVIVVREPQQAACWGKWVRTLKHCSNKKCKKRKEKKSSWLTAFLFFFSGMWRKRGDVMIF